MKLRKEKEYYTLTFSSSKITEDEIKKVRQLPHIIISSISDNHIYCSTAYPEEFNSLVGWTYEKETYNNLCSSCTDAKKLFKKISFLERNYGN